MKPFVSFPPLVIRPASPDDAALLRLIYAPYIQETAITFEKTVPSLKEFRERIVHTLQQYPYLVCEENQEVVKDLCAEMGKVLKEIDDPWYKEGILKDMIPY